MKRISMTPTSITSTESFAARAQRSEATRVVLWIAVLVGMLLLTLLRRWAGGVVMSDGRMFFPYAGVLALAIISQVMLLRVIRRANRMGTLLPEWLWRATAIFDLAVAAALLVIAAFLSPRGAVPIVIKRVATALTGEVDPPRNRVRQDVEAAGHRAGEVTPAPSGASS